MTFMQCDSYLRSEPSNPDAEAIVNLKKVPSNCHSGCPFFWAYRPDRGRDTLGYCLTTLEIPASHKTRAGMTLSCRSHLTVRLAAFGLLDTESGGLGKRGEPW